MVAPLELAGLIGGIGQEGAGKTSLSVIAQVSLGEDLIGGELHGVRRKLPVSSDTSRSRSVCR